MKHCPNPGTPIMKGRDKSRGLVMVHKAGCKLWSCPYCSQKRKGYYAVKAWHGVEQYKTDGLPDWSFGTLTVHERWRGLDKSIPSFRENWNKFYTRLRRSTPDFKYALMPEQHADGTLHTHIISTCMLPTRWWKDQGRACGFGYMNENEPLGSSAYAAWYVTKYVGKTLEVGGWPRGFRRVRFNVRWPEPPPRNDGDWEWGTYLNPKDLRHSLQNDLRDGYRLVNAVSGVIHTPVMKN